MKNYEKAVIGLMITIAVVIVAEFIVNESFPPEIQKEPIQLNFSSVIWGDPYKSFTLNTTNLYHSTHYNIETPGIFGGLYLEKIKPIPEDGILNIEVYSSAKLIIIHYWTLLKDGSYFLDRSVGYQ